MSCNELWNGYHYKLDLASTLGSFSNYFQFERNVEQFDYNALFLFSFIAEQSVETNAECFEDETIEYIG